MFTRKIKIRCSVLKYCTNYVIDSRNPTPEKDPLLQKVSWPKFSEDSLKYLDINSNLTVKTNPRNSTKWLPVFHKYYDHPINVI